MEPVAISTTFIFTFYGNIKHMYLMTHMSVFQTPIVAQGQIDNSSVNETSGPPLLPSQVFLIKKMFGVHPSLIS